MFTEDIVKKTISNKTQQVATAALIPLCQDVDKNYNKSSDELGNICLFGFLV